MKIAMLINSLNLGGAEKLVYDISKKLNCDEFNITVISMGEVQTTLEKSIYEKLKAHNINVEIIGKRPQKDRILSTIKLYKILKKLDIDILHTHGQSPDFYGRLVALFIKKCKVIVTIHSTKGYKKYIEKFFQKITSCYTAVSKEVKEYAQKLEIKKNIDIVYNGIDIERYQNNKENNSKVILSVGRVGEEKGYIELMDSMNSFLLKNTEYRWIILGKINLDNYYVRLKDRIDPRVQDRIEFLDVVENTQDYYKNASFFILNSKYEGFGIVLIEAMAAKLPIITTNVGVVNEVVELGGKMIITRNNNINFETINTITEDDLAKNLEIVKEYYSIEKTIKDYTKIYKDIMGNKNGK